MRFFYTFIIVLLAIAFQQVAVSSPRSRHLWQPRVRQSPPPPPDACEEITKRVNLPAPLIKNDKGRLVRDRNAPQISVFEQYSSYVKDRQTQRKQFIETFKPIFARQNELIAQITNDMFDPHEVFTVGHHSKNVILEPNEDAPLKNPLAMAMEENARKVVEAEAHWWSKKPQKQAPPKMSFLEYIRRAVEYRYRVSYYDFVENCTPEDSIENCAANEVGGQRIRFVDQKNPLTIFQLIQGGKIGKIKTPLVAKLPDPPYYPKEKLESSAFRGTPEFAEYEKLKAAKAPVVNFKFRDLEGPEYKKTADRIKMVFEAVLAKYFSNVDGEINFNNPSIEKLYPADHYDGLVWNTKPENNGWNAQSIKIDEFQTLMKIDRDGVKINLGLTKENRPKFLLNSEVEQTWARVNLLTREGKYVPNPEDIMPEPDPTLREYIKITNAHLDDRISGSWKIYRDCFPADYKKILGAQKAEEDRLKAIAQAKYEAELNKGKAKGIAPPKPD